ncbi:PAT1 homolog 1-like protein [Tanacetum coccineum]
MHETILARNAPGKSSYAKVTGKPSGKKVNVRTLFTPGGNGIDVIVSVDSIHAISERFANTSYGVFLGKKVACPVVANYVRNTWGKYGLVRSMFSSSTGLFSFQFSSMDGLEAMLENCSVNKGSEKPLEKEPMLAARIMIKDGISVLLDVDDIDRILQLVDPLGVSSNTSSGLAPKDDIVFLRVVSLPKASETITALANIVKTCISAIDLNSLSACLAAVVCSPEQLPVSLIGNPAGNGAFIILKSVLESATQLLSVLLKYDSLVQSMYAQIPPSTEIFFSEDAKGIIREIVVELLCASLPHTDDNQRKMLVDFSQRPMHVTGYSGHKGGGHVALADTF